jgi:hypothetical protein
MKGFFLGLVVAALAFAGYVWWKQSQPVAHAPTIPTADAGVVAKGGRERKRRRRSAQWVHGPAAAGSPSDRGRSEGAAPQMDPEPEPIKLSAADLKPVAQGDDLSRPDVLKLDLSSDGAGHELTQDDIDDRFRARQDDILSCISRSRPDEETYVPGRVTVKFRVQRAGTIRGVRVEAPAILMKHGLFGCVKGVLGALRFPASSSSQILSYPFSLS